MSLDYIFWLWDGVVSSILFASFTIFYLVSCEYVVLLREPLHILGLLPFVFCLMRSLSSEVVNL